MTQKVELHRRLTARILLFLALALIPLGIIGVVQNQRLNNEIEQSSVLSLLALTEQAASGERRAIQRNFGAAQMLARTIDPLLDDPELCTETLSRQTLGPNPYAFIGFIRADGISDCSTAPRTIDFSDVDGFEAYVATPRQRLTLEPNGRVSGQNVLIFTQPYYDTGLFKGFVSLSVPLETVTNEPDFFGDADPITLITFNAEGTLLTSDTDRQMAQALLPASTDLEDLANGFARTFTATSRSGRTVNYAVVPIIPGVAYALGLWTPNVAGPAILPSPFVTMLLPFLMWIASLLVAWFVLDRFVVDRVKDLNRAMRAFAETRRMPASNITNMSAELADLNASFCDMAEKIVHDEAIQENRLREKSVLLKEIHHRVKNNLQIISSIMNMQIRKAKAPETQLSLLQVQDRIRGLSEVHRTLYQTENLTEIDAGNLIRELVRHTRVVAEADARLDIDLDLHTVMIFPDQAVPLTMLVSEALTNAIKYIGGPDPRIALALHLDDAKQATLTVQNSIGDGEAPYFDDAHVSGLGRQLIRAFVAQLDGTLDVNETGDTYEIIVRFKVETEQAAPQDY